MSFRYCGIAIILAVLWRHASYAQGDAPTFFRYDRVKRATYAVFRDPGADATGIKSRMLHRLDFESVLGESLNGYRYNQYNFNIASLEYDDITILRFTLVGNTAITRGGGMPLYSEAFRLDPQHAFLTQDRLLERMWMFPVFPREGVHLRKGEKWDFDAPPYPLLISTWADVLTGKLDARTLPPTTIHSQWTGSKEVNGFKCAVIEFFFEVRPADKLRRGKEDATLTVKGISHFSMHLGLPIVTVFHGDGFLVDERGTRKTMDFRRRDVLIDIQVNELDKPEK